MRLTLILALLCASCRIETVSAGANRQSEKTTEPAGEVWVYTSIYRHVLDELDPLLKKTLPHLTVHWFQAGSEKIAAKLEAESAAGGTPCDLLMTSDPFLYVRLKHDGRLLRYVSPNGLRTPAQYVDLDGHFAAVRLSTMVLVYRAGIDSPPVSFAELTQPRWKGEVALGDPLTSGTAFTWAVSMKQSQGTTYFQQLRANEARVAGGNAAVLQKIEGGEAKVGVVLLENALAAKAKGSPLEIAWPRDGAVVIPGYAAILNTTANARGAQAVLDLMFSPEGQAIIARQGQMHAVDPRVPGPEGTVSLEELVKRSAPWSQETLRLGLESGSQVKSEFSQAFAQ